MNRDYTYFCTNTEHEDHTDTFAWSAEEFDKNKDSVKCPICKGKMLIDISVRAVKDNKAIGNRTCLDAGFNYSKAANGRDGRKYH